MSRFLSVLLLALALLYAALPTVAAGRGDWWMFHHDAQHTGRSAFNGPTSLAVKWSFTTGDAVYSSPAIGADGTIYVGSNDYNLYALNADGSKKWAFLTTGGLWWSSPAIAADGTIYVGSQDKNLYAINPDGTQKWVFPTNGAINGSPAIGKDGTIYVTSWFGDLYAISTAGVQQWNFSTGGNIISASPALGADGTIYIGAHDNTLYALNPNGTQKWAFPTGNVINSSPAVGADGTIYIGSYDRNLYAVNPNGTAKWSFATGDYIFSSPAIGADGTIYVGSHDTKLYAIKPSGALKWYYRTGDKIYGSPAIGADGAIYVGSMDNKLYALDRNGAKLWTLTAGDWVMSSPTIASDGTLYAGSDDGKVYAIINKPPTPALTLTKSVSTAKTVPGGTLTYTLAAANTGTGTATNATLTDVVPTTLTYLPNSATGNGSYDSATHTLTWSLGALNAGATAGALTFQTTVNTTVAAGTNINNTAAISCAELLAPTVSNTATVSVIGFTLTPSAGPNGAISPNTNPTVNYGASYPFTATANAGYTVDCWYLDGNAVQNGGAKYTLIYIMANHAVKVTFKSGTGPASSRGNWWMFHHDAQHTGRSPFNGPSQMGQKWVFTTNAAVHSSPAIAADGTIYVGSNDSNLYALNPDGTKKWQFTTGGNIGSSPAIGMDGTIYVGSDDGKLYAITNSGMQKWAFPTADKIWASPTIGADGTIYVGSNDFHLYAINPDGTQKWSFGSTAVFTSPPAIGADGTIYLGSENWNFYALTPDGQQKWAFPTGSIINTAPAIDAVGTIYFGSYDQNLYALTPEGKQKWAINLKKLLRSSPAIGKDGTIYLGSTDDQIYAVKPDGSLQWQFATNGPVVSSPAIGADGTIYVGSEDGHVYALNPDGTKKGDVTIGTVVDSSPAIGADGTLYIGTNDGNLSAIVTPPSLTLTKTVTPVKAQPGNTVTYTLTAKNTGTGSASKVMIADVIPPALTYVPGSASGNGNYNATACTLTWSLGVLNAGAPTSALTFKATVNTTVTAGTNITNTAAISCAELPSLSVSNSATVTVVGFTITPSAGSNGTITPSSLQTMNYGNNIAFIAAANTGYTTDTWALDGTTVQSGGAQYMLKNITANHAVKVTFKQLSFTISPSAGVNGTLTPNSPQTLAYGGSMTFTAAANTGYTTAVWQLDNITVQTGGMSFTVKNVTGNHTLMVTFKPLTFTITAAAGANGTITPSMSQQVNYGSSPTFTAVANAGYTVDTWYLDTVAVQNGGAQYLLPYVTANHAVKVTFKLSNTPSPIHGDWWMFQHDRQHTGRSSVNGPDAPVQKWAFATGSRINRSSPVIGADGTIYIGAEDNNLYAVTAAGVKKWAFATGGAIEGTAAIGTDGTIYVGSNDKNFYAINADGTKKWTLTTGGMINSSPVIGADGVIYFGADDHKLYAVNPNGTLKWPNPFTAGSTIDSSPAIGMDGTIYVGVDDMQLYAINPDGTKKWTCSVGDMVMKASPAIGADGTIYMGSYMGKLFAIAPDGTKKWSFSATWAFFSTPAIGADGTIYIGSADRNLYAITPAGARKWSMPVNSDIWASAAIDANGIVYVGTEGNYLYAINPDGTAKWAQPFVAGDAIGSSSAIGADGTLYFGARDGKLYAINAARPSLIISKSVTPATTVPGGTVLYTLSGKNTGRAAGSTVKITDVLPATLTYVPGSASGNGSYNTATNTLIWSLGTLNAGSSSTAMTFRATVKTTVVAGTNITNTAGISCTELPTPAVSQAAIVSVTGFTVTPTAGLNGTITPIAPQTVNYGGSIAFTAGVNTGYTVDSWQLDSATVQTGGIHYTLKNIIANHAVTVTFKPLTFTITPSIAANGLLSPSTPQTVSYGNAVTFTATANAGYTTDTWLVDGVAAQTGGATYTLKNVTANHAVTVSFKQLTFTITPTAGANGKVSPSTMQTIKYGSNLTFTATANATFMVDAWLLDGVTAQIGGATYQLKNITANHTIQVTFKLQTFLITPVAAPDGTISPSTPQTVTYGGSISFTAAAYAGYTVNCWTLDGIVVQTGKTAYTLKNVTANHTVLVKFISIYKNRPDLSICNLGDPVYLGWGIISLNGAGQTKTQMAASSATVTYLWRVENCGYTSDTFTLTCPLPAQSGWKVQIIDHLTGNDITALMTGVGYTTGVLAPDVAEGFTLTVTPTIAVTAGTAYPLLITGMSINDKTKLDAVKAVTTRK